MRPSGPLVVLMLLATAAPIALANHDMTCTFNSHSHVILPGSSIYVSVDRSSCTTHGVTVHKERTLVSDGDPRTEGHVVLAVVEVVSTKADNGGGAVDVTDTVAVGSGDDGAVATYKTSRDSGGFTTCQAGVDARQGWSRVSFWSQPLSVCVPAEWAHV